MPQKENYLGWEPSIELRSGQKDTLEFFAETSNQSDYLFSLPTGYGKSFVALSVYHIAKLQGRCNRLLIVVASEIQRKQYAKEIAKDANTLGISFISNKYGHIARECLGEGHVLKASLKNECEIFLTTIQKMDADLSFYHDLMEKHLWMGVFDEAHRYSVSNGWGKLLSELNFSVKVGLTATPIRSDKSQLACTFKKECDVIVSTRNAIKEKAIRPFILKIADYEVDLSMEGHVRPMKLSEIAEEMKQGKFTCASDWEIKRQARYSSKYIQDIFYKATNAYHELECKYPNQNQIIVFAWSCEHAKVVCQSINKIMMSDEDSSVFADWMGTGLRSDKENQAVMDSFMAKENFLSCLVQVDKASEGFNNPRCSIAIFLNAINVDTPKLQQMLGRVMRIKPGITSPQAYVFAGVDHPLASADMDELGAIFEMEDDLSGDGDGTGGGVTIRIPNISDVFLFVRQLIGLSTISPFLQDQTPETVTQKLIDSGKYDPNDYDLLLKNITELAESQKPSLPELSHEEKIKHLRNENNKAVKSLVGGAIRLKYRDMKIPGTVNGDWYKKTNYWLSRRFGGKVENLGEDELMRRHEYIKEIADKINKTKEVPSWMMP